MTKTFSPWTSFSLEGLHILLKVSMRIFLTNKVDTLFNNFILFKKTLNDLGYYLHLYSDVCTHMSKYISKFIKISMRILIHSVVVSH
jgi:hypothetical protein